MKRRPSHVTHVSICNKIQTESRNVNFTCIACSNEYYMFRQISGQYEFIPDFVKVN